MPHQHRLLCIGCQFGGAHLACVCSLKPLNVLVSVPGRAGFLEGDDTIKLADLGSAQPVDKDGLLASNNIVYALPAATWHTCQQRHPGATLL